MLAEYPTSLTGTIVSSRTELYRTTLTLLNNRMRSPKHIFLHTYTAITILQNTKEKSRKYRRSPLTLWYISISAFYLDCQRATPRVGKEMIFFFLVGRFHEPVCFVQLSALAQVLPLIKVVIAFP